VRNRFPEPAELGALAGRPLGSLTGAREILPEPTVVQNLVNPYVSHCVWDCFGSFWKLSESILKSQKTKSEPKHAPTKPFTKQKHRVYDTSNFWRFRVWFWSLPKAIEKLMEIKGTHAGHYKIG